MTIIYLDLGLILIFLGLALGIFTLWLYHHLR